MSVICSDAIPVATIASRISRCTASTSLDAAASTAPGPVSLSARYGPRSRVATIEPRMERITRSLMRLIVNSVEIIEQKTTSSSATIIPA